MDTRRWRFRNVPVPEPHVAALLAGGILQVVRPWPVPVDGRIRLGTGTLLLLVGLFVVAAAVRAAGPERLDSPDSLLIEGPYRYSRNPMYIGWTAIYAGVSLAGNLAWPMVLLPAVAVAIHRTVRREERALERQFGDTYRAYARDVPRYL